MTRHIGAPSVDSCKAHVDFPWMTVVMLSNTEYDYFNIPKYLTLS